MKNTRHFIARAVERRICDAEIREVLTDVRADGRFAAALADLLDRGETIAAGRRGVVLVLAPAVDDVRVLTTYRRGKR